MAIEIEKELAEAQSKLPIVMPDGPMPLDVQMRSIALTIAARFVSETCVKEGGLYQQLKMDNKLGSPVSVEHALKAALVFERYLWGEWSKGIAEHAMGQVSTEAADSMEAVYKAKLKERGVEIEGEFKDEPPIRPYGE